MSARHRLPILLAFLPLASALPALPASVPPIPEVALVGQALSDNGDADGYADTNETVQLEITIRNVLETALTGLTAVLETDDPKVECLIQHAVWVGDLAAGETRTLPAFAFKVADVNRGDPHEDFSVTFRVLLTSAVSGPAVLWPDHVLLDLDLDVTGGASPGPYFEGFESGGFGTLTTMNLDAGKFGPGAADGYRCQFTDPDWFNSNNYGQPDYYDCWLGVSAEHADKYYWQVSDGDPGATVPGRSHTGRYSVYMGEYLPDVNDWTVPMASLEALGSADPVNLGAGRVCESTRTTACADDLDCPGGESCVGVASELSLKQQVDFLDWRLWLSNYGRCAHGGAVAVQLADEAGDPVGPWIKIYPHSNLYDQPRDDNWVNCQFDPVDDGNTEDDFYDPLDPEREYGPSTMCFPEPLFVYLGDTDAPYDPDEIGRASDGPGLPGATGPGTWVESRFDLRPFQGRRIRIRFISGGVHPNSATETFEDGWHLNPTAGDDGWWIDDILITDTLAVPAVLVVDSKDNSGLPGVTDGDGDRYCDSDCDDGDATCNVDCSDTDADGMRICDGDCDDTNPDVYLGAEEVCDGVSNDCEEPLWPQLEVWTPTAIAGPEARAVSVFAADVDGDGDLDSVTASYDTDTIAWHENTAGDGSAWATHTISTTAEGATGVHAADMNGDGYTDVLAASALDTTIAWYENTAGDGSTWTQREITAALQYAGGVIAADVDDDGDMDVLAAGADNDRVRWYENVTGDGTAWSPVTIVPAPSLAVSVVGADMDGDGDVDVAVSGVIDGSRETWWYKNKRGDGAMWEAYQVDRYFVVQVLQVADIDADGDADLLAGQTGRSEVWWYENLSTSGAEWSRRYLADPVGEVRSIVAADLDGDSDVDVLAAGSWFGEVLWFENAAGDATAWTARAVSRDVAGAAAADVGDVDGDGDLDVLSGGAEEVAWHSRGNLELDDDGDGVADCAGDCDDTDVTVWGLPGEVQDLTLLEDRQTLVWSAPADPGATSVVYNTLRGETPDGFLGATCVEWGDGSDTEAVDTGAPSSGAVYYYLVVAVNGCGTGCAGAGSEEEEREVCACP